MSDFASEAKLSTSRPAKEFVELPHDMRSADTAQDSLEIAELFIATVQGDFSLESCAIEAGELVKSSQPIPRRSKANFALAAQILRTLAPLPDAIEQWVINLFDQRTADLYMREDWESVTYRIKEIRRRRKGRPWNPLYTDWVSSLPADTLNAVEALRSNLAEILTDDLTALCIAFANKRPLSAADRAWLADLFDPASQFDFQINARTFVRRNRGAKAIGPNPAWFGWEASRRVADLLRDGVLWKTAIWQIAKEYCKSESHIESAVQFGRIARKAFIDRP